VVSVLLFPPATEAINNMMTETPPASAQASTEQIVESRTSPALVILTSSKQLIYMDRSAHELSNRINAIQHHHTARGVLPIVFMELCEEVMRAGCHNGEAQDWENARSTRVVPDPKTPLLLRAIALPALNGIDQFLVLITIEEVGRKPRLADERRKSAFGFTDRQLTVVQHLLNGWTNKEIANEMGIAEQAVKEHMKRIMEKTGVATRTGLIIKVLQSAS
jgi:DNA-binding NarL/FixJ family response regulator